MRLSTKSRYGTRLVLDIALNSKDGPVRISEVAKRQKISVKYLERIVQILKNAGYVESKRGQKGGHLLAKPFDQISVGEIIRALEGDDILVECVRPAPDCSHAPACLTRRVWMEASRVMFERLDKITIAELVHYAEEGMTFDCDRFGLPHLFGGKAANDAP